jgi:hypothetical protein
MSQADCKRTDSWSLSNQLERRVTQTHEQDHGDECNENRIRRYAPARDSASRAVLIPVHLVFVCLFNPRPTGVLRRWSLVMVILVVAKVVVVVMEMNSHPL